MGLVKNIGVWLFLGVLVFVLAYATRLALESHDVRMNYINRCIIENKEVPEVTEYCWALWRRKDQQK